MPEKAVARRYFVVDGAVPFKIGYRDRVDSSFIDLTRGGFPHVSPTRIVTIADNACARVIRLAQKEQDPESLAAGVRPVTSDFRIRFFGSVKEGDHLTVTAAILSVDAKAFQVGFEVWAGRPKSPKLVAHGASRFVAFMGDKRVAPPFAPCSTVEVQRSIISLVPELQLPEQRETLVGRVMQTEANNAGLWHGGHFMRVITAAGILRFEELLDSAGSWSQMASIERGQSLIAVVAEEINLLWPGKMDDFPEVTTKVVSATKHRIVIDASVDVFRVSEARNLNIGNGRMVLALAAATSGRLSVQPHTLKF